MSSLVISIICFFVTRTSAFNEGTATLPRPSTFMAVGYDTTNESILLMGDYGTGTSLYYSQFVLFMINDHSFVDNQSYLLPAPSDNAWFAGTQQYTQLETELWMIRNDESGKTFIVVDTQSHRPQYPLITSPNGVSSLSCLASNDHYLMVLGGGGPFASQTEPLVQIYDLDKQIWLDNTPQLPEPRKNMACIAVNNILYGIAGLNRTNFQTTVLTLDISDMNLIATQSWQRLTGRLSEPLIGTKAVAYGNDILLIGGEDVNARPVSVVHVIDTQTGDCQVDNTLTLAFAVANAAPIIVGNTLFVFGGEIFSKGSSAATDKYQYMTLPSLEPSTRFPTSSPIVYPSSSPMVSITPNPTAYPSTNPSSSPITRDPSVHPTRFPSSSPVFDPSSSAIISMYPSMHPTPLSSVSYPSSSPTLSDRYTISIEIGRCKNEEQADECNVFVNETTMTKQISNVLVALNYDPQILSRDVVEKKIILIVSITTASNALDVDVIERELSDYDIEVFVTATDSDDDDDDDSSDDQEMKHNPDLFSDPVAISIIGATSLLIIVVSLAVIYRFCLKRTAKKQTQIAEMVQQNTIVNNVIEDDGFDIGITDPDPVQIEPGDDDERRTSQMEGHKRESQKMTSEGPEDGRFEFGKDINDVSINSEKIWSSKAQLVDMLYRTPEPIPLHMNKHRVELQMWLKNEVHLAQYFDVFVNNGYDSVQTVQHISSTTELKEIGITIKDHQTHIMAQINQLRGTIKDNMVMIQAGTTSTKGLQTLKEICNAKLAVEKVVNNDNKSDLMEYTQEGPNDIDDVSENRYVDNETAMPSTTRGTSRTTAIQRPTDVTKQTYAKGDVVDDV